MDGPAGAYHYLFAHLHKGVVDELTVWQRALSDEELERLYGAGAEGRALAQAPS